MLRNGRSEVILFILRDLCYLLFQSTAAFNGFQKAKFLQRFVRMTSKKTKMIRKHAEALGGG